MKPGDKVLIKPAGVGFKKTSMISGVETDHAPVAVLVTHVWPDGDFEAKPISGSSTHIYPASSLA